MTFVDDITRRTVLKGLAGLAAAKGAAVAGSAEARASTDAALSASERPTFANSTAVHIGDVGLRVRDLDRTAAWYRDVIGLSVLEATPSTAILGAPGVPLLALEARPDDAPDSPRMAGLFHTAFLMPTRTDLGRWLVHVARNRIPVTGVADHLVSEALYLTDPEGNGIEVYADRPKDAWQWDGPSVAMATKRLDIDGLLASVPAGAADWNGAPENTIIGHVHLRVGDPIEAEQFWNEAYGFDTVAKYGPAAVFLSTGGYHHHIGANVWQSAGAGQRDPGRSGLSWIELRATDGKYAGEKADPWGTVIRTVEAPPA